MDAKLRLPFMKDRRSGLVVDLKTAVGEERWTEVLILTRHLIALDTQLALSQSDEKQPGEH